MSDEPARTIPEDCTCDRTDPVFGHAEDCPVYARICGALEAIAEEAKRQGGFRLEFGERDE